MSGQGPRRPGSPGDPGDLPPGETIEIEDEFDESFEDAPATDPTVPALDELFAARLADRFTAPAADPQAALGDESPVLFAPTLPEMEADIWQAGMEALVSVPAQAVAAPPAAAEWRADAHLYRDESALAASQYIEAALY